MYLKICVSIKNISLMLRKIFYVIIFSFIGINSALVKAQSIFFIEPIVFNKVNTIKYSYLPTYYDKSEIFSLKPNRFNFNQKVNFGVAVGVDFPKRMTSISLAILEDFVGSNYGYSVNYFESNVSKFYTSKSINQTNLNVGIKIKRVLLTNHRFLFSNKLFYQTDLVFGINSLNGLFNKQL